MASTDHDEDEATAGELALGLLDGDDRTAALRRLLSDPAFAQRVARWRERLAIWFDDWPEAEPPAYRDPVGIGAARGNGVARGWRSAAIAALATAACALFALLLRPGTAPAPVAPKPQPMLVATLSGDERSPFAIIYDPAARTIRVPGELTVAPGRAHQLWAIGGDGVPRSLGLLAPTAQFSRVLRPAEARLIRVGDTLAVSVEPAGGAPGDAPTGPVVATGTIVTT